MFGRSALATAFRCMLFGVLLCGFVLKPTLAFADEIHELTAHAAADHGHLDQHVPAPSDGDGDRTDHDDKHWHLSHCCGQQAAVLPRLELPPPPPSATAPLPPATVVTVLTPLLAPFRPPIAA